MGIGYKDGSGGFLKLGVTSRPTTHYIWRTSKDGKVRRSHAANDGKIFAWNNPPETGHPGEDYGCRCRAEPYYGLVEEKPSNAYPSNTAILLDIFRLILANTPKWGNLHLSMHFYSGNGKGVRLDEIGHLEEVKAHYINHHLYHFTQQLYSSSLGRPDGHFTDDFRNTYNFYDVLYSYRQSTISGEFHGFITTAAFGEKTLKGTAYFEFYDEFKDPIEIAQSLTKILDTFPLMPPFKEADLPELIKDSSNLKGTPYTITGEWIVDIEQPVG